MDLGNWAAERYVVSEPLFDEDDESDTASSKTDADPDEPEH
jgi:endogenous inhibitor of DNA gyrase (YacG/DUF329 family)